MLPIKPRSILPFPVERLAHVRRRDVERLRQLARLLPRGLDGLQVEGVAICPAMPSTGLRVELMREDRRFALLLESGAAIAEARRLLGLAPDELGAPRPPTLAEEGALELMLERALGDAARIDRVAHLDAQSGKTPSASAAVFYVQLRLRLANGRRTVVYAELPASLDLVPPPVRERAEGQGAAAALGRLSAVPVQLWIEVGRSRLEPAELRSLAVRDVVLFDELVRDVRGGPVQLRFGRGAFAARLDGETLIVEDFFRLYGGGHPMSDVENKIGPDAQRQTESAAATHADQLLGELSVEIVCELGRVSMSGRDLVELRPGAVITAGRPLSGPVDLTVGGRLVARGELVDVEGELGVRVSQLID